MEGMHSYDGDNTMLLGSDSEFDKDITGSESCQQDIDFDRAKEFTMNYESLTSKFFENLRQENTAVFDDVIDEINAQIDKLWGLTHCSPNKDVEEAAEQAMAKITKRVHRGI